MFQLYHHGDRGWVSELLARVETSGYRAVALTVDTQLYGRRERDIYARWSPREAMEIDDFLQAAAILTHWLAVEAT